MGVARRLHRLSDQVEEQIFIVLDYNITGNNVSTFHCFGCSLDEFPAWRSHVQLW